MSAQAAVQTQSVTKPTITPITHGLLQRCTATQECDECRKKREGMLQRAAVDSSPVSEVPPIVHEVLRSPGHPLDARTRMFMEPRFGHDFSNVRVHTDAKAAKSARAVNALAYTVGRNVVFGTGQFNPETISGQRLVAHELAHTIQQGGISPTVGNISIDRADSSLEHEANHAAIQVVRNHNFDLRKVSLPTTQRRTPLNRNPTLVRQYQPSGTRKIMQRSVFGAIGEFFSRLFFEGTFTEDELLSYLKYLDDKREIEGNYDSDNKAREIIRRWRAGNPKFNPTISQKQLMLLELIDGPTLDADEHAILELLRGSSNEEVQKLIGTAGGEEALRDEFQGSEADELDAFLAVWHQDPRYRSITTDEVGRGKVTISEIVVNQNSPQVVTVHYSDGRSEANICSTGKGTCCVEPGSETGPTPRETCVGDSNWTPTRRRPYYVQFTEENHNGIKWWTQFHTRGIALHQYEPVDGTPLSHGCVRLNADFAKRIYRGALSLKDAKKRGVPINRVTIVRVVGIPRPRCGHEALMHEWEKDFNKGTGRPTDGEAVNVRKHLRLAFGHANDTELDQRIAMSIVPRCNGRVERRRTR